LLKEIAWRQAIKLNKKVANPPYTIDSTHLSSDVANTKMKLKQKLYIIVPKEYPNADKITILLFLPGSVPRNQKNHVFIIIIAHCIIENKGDANWITFDRSLQ
jgi:hypothetical protein